MPEYTPDQDQARKNLRRYAAERGAQSVPNEVYKKALDDGLITYNELVEWNMPTDRIQLITNGSVPPPPIPGCMDATATNYDPKATEDDGSCIYMPEGDSEDDDDDIEPKTEPFEDRTLQQLENDVRNGNLTEAEVRQKLDLSKKDWDNIRRHYNENRIPAWAATPVLVAKKTDLWVFGIPGSGKTAMLSAVLGRLAEQGILMPPDFNQIHEDGYLYRNYLEAAYKLNMFPEPSQAEGFNYVPMDLMSGDDYRPANLIEMAGEKVRGLLGQRGSKDENSLNALQWLKSPNSKVITIVLDITSRDFNQNNELSLVLGLLKDKGVLKKTTKIILLATKVDTLESFGETHTGALDEEIDQKVEENFNSLVMYVKRLTRKNIWGKTKIAAVKVPFSVGGDIVKEKYLKGKRHNSYVDLYVQELMESIDIRKYQA
jgi:hypothetical protein